MIKQKLAPYSTASQLHIRGKIRLLKVKQYTLNLKVMWHRTSMNIKNLSSQNFDIVL